MTTLLLAAGLVGCKNDLIESVKLKPSNDLSSVRVTLVFTDKVKLKLDRDVPLKDYGTLFVSPYSPEQHFELGLELDAKNIFYDTDYIHLEPTTNLPNGVPLGMGYPLVEIRAPESITDNFDMYGYVDVTQYSWLGTAAMFKFIDGETFPRDLAINQVCAKDKEGKATIIASVFGPTMNADGSIKTFGGIALLANVRKLIEEGKVQPGAESSFAADGLVEVNGANADPYRNPKALKKIESRLIRAFNR